MHEMSLAEGIIQIVGDTARANGGTRVSAVTLEVGRLAAVELDALRFCFDVVSRGSLAEGARLEVVRPEGQAWCLPCARTVTVVATGEPCPHCGSYQLQVTGGTELKVKDIEIQ
jgi:hydrogenase nickel incorporation protein HypA/HybF